jgi:hypothetical protein
MTSVLFAALALIPAMIGPVQSSSIRTITVALCEGGTMAIPVGGSPSGPESKGACCEKGCHSSSSRKRLDRAQ